MAGSSEPRALLSWLDGASAQRGLHVAGDGDAWSFTSYAELASRVRRASFELGQTGVRPGDRVAIAAPAPDDFAVAFFGVLAAGASPIPLPLPQSLTNLDAYLDLAGSMLRVAEPRLLLTPGAFSELAGRAIGASGLDLPVHTLALTGEEGAVRRAPDGTPALLQFTSGSSGRPRAVRVAWSNLEANCHAIARWLDFSDQRICSTWLPLYHDMGLIGAMVSPFLHSSELWSMRPDQFVRSPLRWLACHGQRGADLCATPNFGLAYVLRRVVQADVADMDFSGWRFVVIGADRIEPAILRRFAALLAPAGFRQEAFRPAYGLAEATVAVSGWPGGRVRAVRPRWSDLAPGRPVTIEADTTVDVAAVEETAGWVVSCGRPLTGVSVEVIDDDQRPVGEGVAGELVVRGASVAAGYLGQESSATFPEPGRLHTGDAGFLMDGEVFVVGRLGDSLKVRGRHLYAEDLEGRVASACGLPVNRTAVLLGSVPGASLVGLVLEADGRRPAVRDAVDVLRREAGGESEIRVHLAPRGTILRTTSGKVRRRVLWTRLLDGTLAGQRLVVPPGSGAQQPAQL